jgi:hypothetical protein
MSVHLIPPGLKEKAESEAGLIDIGATAVATIWVGFYAISIMHGVAHRTFAAAIELATRY